MSETVKIGEKEYQVIKTGRAQASQVLAITKWLSKYGIPALNELDREQVLEGVTGITLISGLIEHLNTDALIDLFSALIGCTKEESEVYFDIAIMVDVAVDVYEGNQSIRRLIERFFFTQDSEEEQQTESSTPSEESTDGQTETS